MTRKQKKQDRRRARGRRRQPQKGRRFTVEQRREAMRLIGSGLKRTEVARMLETTVESLRRWTKAQDIASALEKESPKTKSTPSTSTREPGAKPSDEPPVTGVGGLAPVEVEAILALKKEHPSMGPAQIRAQLKRFRGWRLSVKTIARVLVRAGYRLVRKQGRPEGQETFTRFEAPRRNALWLFRLGVRAATTTRFVSLSVSDFPKEGREAPSRPIRAKGQGSQAVSRGAEGAERSELALDAAENLGMTRPDIPIGGRS